MQIPPNKYHFTNLKVTLFKILIVYLCGITTANSQDISFDQYYQTPFLSNVAIIGIDTNINAAFNYRQQPLPTGERFSTAMFSASYPIFKRKQVKTETQAAIGINILNDNFTDFFQTFGASLALTYNQPITENLVASFGMQAGFFQQSLNLNNITTDNQFLTGTFDPSASINETFNNTNSSYFLVGSSLFMYWKGRYSILPQKFVGISYNNFNQPSRNFLENGNDKIPSNLTFMSGFRIQQGLKINWMPNVRAVYRLNEFYGMIGTWMYYDLSPVPQESHLALGLWYNTNQSLAVGVEVLQKKYSATFSYNLPINERSTSWQGSGSIELSLGIKINRKRKVKIPKIDSIPDDTLYVVEELTIPTDTFLIGRNEEVLLIVVQNIKSYFGGDSLIRDTLNIQRVEEFIAQNPDSIPIIDTFYVDAELEYTTRSILFDELSEKLITENNDDLFEVISILLTDETVGIELRGYLSQLEIARGELMLSKRRCEQTKGFLISQGIDEKRIIVNPFQEVPPDKINTNIPQNKQESRIDCVFFIRIIE